MLKLASPVLACSIVCSVVCASLVRADDAGVSDDAGAPEASAEAGDATPAVVDVVPVDAGVDGLDELPMLSDETADDDAVVVDGSVGVDDEDPADLGATTVTGDARQRRRLAGSAQVVGEEELERYEYDDVHRVLKQVPGVYVRDEEGFGLRPNIGLRGASSDRSSKVTIMEDGVLLTPAPYSAPAAYYFPLTTRMTAIEVFKGPAAIKAGPHTVGGAINMRTRRIPYGVAGGVDVAGGAYGTGKLHAHVGYGIENVGVLIEGVHLQSDGFKQLDNGGPTGFMRNDVMAKARVSTDADATFFHGLELKLGWQDETSNETYLGLTNDDFEQSPYRRYVASATDKMTWTRIQGAGTYTFRFEGVTLDVTAYRHNFTRTWRRLNRFATGPDLGTLLANPDGGQNAVLVSILRGESDSETLGQTLLVANNERAFFSQGVQARATTGFDLFGVRQDIEFGARVHQDQIERHHTEHGLLMRSGTLVPDGRNAVTTARNRATTTAGSLYVLDEIDVLRWFLLTPGLRLELVDTRFIELESGERIDGTPFMWMPGVGLSTTLLNAITLFTGVYKGGSPSAPGQGPDVLPEESLNVEVGTRLYAGRSSLEAIGFASHYTNLSGSCTFSAGCLDDDLGQQFNAGQVLVGGLEVMASHRIHHRGLMLGADLAYTYTKTRFLSSFSSSNPQWGEVEEGFELPYVPEHQAALLLTAGIGGLEMAWSLAGVAPMRDVAGTGAIPKGTGTDPQMFVDARTSYALWSGAKVYFTVDNVLMSQAVAARRPFGARPAKAFSYTLGFKQEFDFLF